MGQYIRQDCEEECKYVPGEHVRHLEDERHYLHGNVHE